MSTKQKPKWPWTFGSSFPYLKDENFQKIANVLHVSKSKITKEIRSQIQDAIREYASNKNFLEGPSETQVKSKLSLVRDKTKDLLDCLNLLDDITMQKLASTKAFPKAEIYDPTTIKTIDKIHLAAKEALEKLNRVKKGRRKTKTALVGFVIDLKPIFEEITSLKASITNNPYKDKDNYQGPFYDFIHTCLEIVNEAEIWSNSSLGQQIKKGLHLTK